VEIQDGLERNIPWIPFCGGQIRMVNLGGTVATDLGVRVGILNVVLSACVTFVVKAI